MNENNHPKLLEKRRNFTETTLEELEFIIQFELREIDENVIAFKLSNILCSKFQYKNGVKCLFR